MATNVSALLSVALTLALPHTLHAAQFWGSANTITQTAGAVTAEPASYTATDSDGSFAHAVTNAVRGGNVLAESTSQRLRAGATAVVSYTFQVVGPDNLDVPVRVQASGFATGTGLDHQATSSFSLERSYNSPLSNLSATVTSTGTTPGRKEWSVDEVVVLKPNLDIYVSISAIAISLTTAGPSSATAFADPLFTIDPNFSGAYVLVGIPSAVPEPATWALLLAGGTVCGWRVRFGRNLAPSA